MTSDPHTAGARSTASRPIAVEHPFDRRRRTISGIAGLLAFGLVIAVPTGLQQATERSTAIGGYEQALAGFADADADFADARGRLDTAREDVNGLANLLSPITAMSGEPIPADAAARLEAARAAAVAAIAPPAAEPPVAPGSLDPAELLVPELRAEAADARQATGALQALTAQYAASDAQGERLGADLGQDLAAYLDAVQQRGYALLAAHPTAAPEAVDAYRSALDALSDVPTESIPADLLAVQSALAALG